MWCHVGAVAISDRAVAPQQSLCLASKQRRSSGGGGVQSGQRRRGKGFVKKSRNSSGWQMKSVHSSKAAPYRQPAEQSQGLNEGQDNGGAQY